MTSPATPYPATARTGHAHAALLLMVVIWGINFPVAKAALAEMSPLAFNALRFPLAAFTVYLALRLRGPLQWPRSEDRARVIGLGILGNVLYQLFFIYGLALTRAGTASVLLAGTPVITALLSAALGHERIVPRTWIGVAATVCGILLVVLFGDAATGTASLMGDALMVGASLSWAIYTIGSRSLIARYGSMQFTAWTLWTGTAGLLLIGLPDVLHLRFAEVSAGAWIGVFYAGALSVGVAYLIWYSGVRILGNTRTATYSNLVPVVALTAAWLQLGEVPTPGQLVGAGIIIAGISLAQSRR